MMMKSPTPCAALVSKPFMNLFMNPENLRDYLPQIESAGRGCKGTLAQRVAPQCCLWILSLWSVLTHSFLIFHKAVKTVMLQWALGVWLFSTVLICVLLIWNLYGNWAAVFIEIVFIALDSLVYWIFNLIIVNQPEYRKTNTRCLFITEEKTKVASRNGTWHA